MYKNYTWVFYFSLDKHPCMNYSKRMKIITPELRSLRECFLNESKDIRFVGGCIRSLLLNQEPKDIDLCTDATPEEQQFIYNKYNIKFIPTGIDHGTITVVLNDNSYEITTLRTESQHDGRHCKSQWTTDWIEDLSRRDLTINSISMTFEEEFIDPFNGINDLKNKKVRFVGNTKERMKEDYLRILRWFRFHGRIIPNENFDNDALYALKDIDILNGLRTISNERIWSELKQILIGNGVEQILLAFNDFNINNVINLPPISNIKIQNLKNINSNNPITILAYLVDDKKFINEWNFSNDEKKLFNFIYDFKNKEIDPKELIIINNYSKSFVDELLKVKNIVFDTNFEIPIFPITGNDLINIGYSQGKELGIIIKKLKSIWKENNYTMSKEDLITSI